MTDPSSAVLHVNSANVTEGVAITILSGGSVSGTFTGLADGAILATGLQDYRINYVGSTVLMTAVPEPLQTTGATGLILLGGAFLRHRHGRRGRAISCGS